MTAQRSSGALAYVRPDVIPDHPADVAARRYEENFVGERRSQGVSWANISRMLGKAEADLRREYESKPGMVRP